MLKKLNIWFRKRYRSITGSIAFYPAFIALIFIGASILLTTYDFSNSGKLIKSQMPWLSLKDATTARSIISSIVSGIISLTVFSFSLVMIILNQTASQMSNRILDQLIGNRFQQYVLGFYIGTIVFALYLLSTVRDIDSGISIPALSTYVLIILTVVDIFLFIYFLHYITQSVKYEVIIERIADETIEVMQAEFDQKNRKDEAAVHEKMFPILSRLTGIYQGFDEQILTSVCTENCFRVREVHYRGRLVYKGSILLEVNKEIDEKKRESIADACYVINAETIQNNAFYGFRQLTEVAVKALSPGINDPATAIQTLQAQARLFLFYLEHIPGNTIFNKENDVSIHLIIKPFGDLVREVLYPIWDYGQKDRMIQQAMHNIVSHLLTKKKVPELLKLFEKVEEAIGNRDLN